MNKEGVRIYDMFPTLVGTVEKWKSQVDRIADMGFNWIFVNPFHETGASGSLYAVRDYFNLNPAFRGRSRKSSQEILAGFVATAEKRGLGVMMDLVINHTAFDSPLINEHPQWYAREPDGRVSQPFAIDPADINKKTVWEDLAELDYTDRPVRPEMIDYFAGVIEFYLAAGIRGFRCDAAYKVPMDVWRALIDRTRSRANGTVFLAENLGALMEQVEAMRGGGFDYLYNSAKWWDFEQGWLLEQYDRFGSIAPSITFPATHDTERLITDLEASGIHGVPEVERAYRRAWLFSTLFSTGVMMPIGFEYGFRKKLHVVETTPNDWEEPAFDLSAFVAAANQMKASAPVLNEEGPQRRVHFDDNRVCCLMRRGQSDGSRWAVSLINRDLHASVTVNVHGVDGDVHGGREITPGRGDGTLTAGDSVTLEPAEVRVFING